MDDPVSAGVRGDMVIGANWGGEEGIATGSGGGEVGTTWVCDCWCIGRGPLGVGGKGRPLLVGLRVAEDCGVVWGA